MRDRMLAGEAYIADDPQLVEESRRAMGLTHRINTTDPTERDTLRALFTELLGEYGEESTIRPPFHCDYGFNIRLGEGVFLNFNCVILDVVEVTIGDKTQIAPGVQILTADHPRSPEVRASGLEFGRPIHIGRNVWIGGGAIILPGVTIGDDALIGAGSVVTRDVPAGATVVGNPARVLPPRPPQA